MQWLHHLPKFWEMVRLFFRRYPSSSLRFLGRQGGDVRASLKRHQQTQHLGETPRLRSGSWQRTQTPAKRLKMYGRVPNLATAENPHPVSPKNRRDEDGAPPRRSPPVPPPKKRRYDGGD